MPAGASACRVTGGPAVSSMLAEGTAADAGAGVAAGVSGPAGFRQRGRRSPAFHWLLVAYAGFRHFDCCRELACLRGLLHLRGDDGGGLRRGRLHG